MNRRFDVGVIGAGFGGLATALSLAERGLGVVLFEALAYPGGCASTFTRRGFSFDAGATIAGGFGPGQIFDRWREAHRMPIRFKASDPRAELRWDEGRMPIDADRSAFVDRLAAGPRAAAVRRYFDVQRRIADTTWPLLDDPDLLPPLTASSLRRHLGRIPAYLRLLPVLGRSAAAVLESTGGGTDAARLWLDAGCRISIQCGAAEAEAVFALSAVDWWWRGVGHVSGGMGALADAMVQAIRNLGGEVRLADRVTGLTPTAAGWSLESRNGGAEVAQVVANLLPHDLAALIGPTPRLERMQRAVQTGWGAVMLYAVAEDPPDAPAHAVHLQLVDRPDLPLIEGNHAFVSVSSRQDGFAPPGQRSITISTHANLAAWGDDRAVRVETIQGRMRELVRRHAPEWSRWTLDLPASPRTFARFVRRSGGWVGGVPRRVRDWPVTELFPRPIRPGLWLVGDSTFPGQSTVATAVGGHRVAAALRAGWKDRAR
jgi:phytoene dehydrogenase-like protein